MDINKIGVGIRTGALVFLLSILVGVYLQGHIIANASPLELCLIFGCLVFPTIPIFGAVHLMMTGNETVPSGVSRDLLRVEVVQTRL